MRPDHDAAQRQVGGQKFLGQLHQRAALTFEAVEVARGRGNIDHEQCLMGKLVGLSYNSIDEASAINVFDRRLGHFCRLKESTVHSRKKRCGGLAEGNIF